MNAQRQARLALAGIALVAATAVGSIGLVAAQEANSLAPGTITTVNHPGCRADCGLNDDWSYAGQVNAHPGCWQLTLSPTLAEFQCADGQRFTLVAR